MTAQQSLQIYEILNRYFKNDVDAKQLTQQIEIAIEKKVEDSKIELATKKDLLELKVDLADRINKSKTETIIWIVAIGIVQFLMAILAKKYL